VPGVSTEPNNTPEPGQNHPTSTIQHPALSIEYQESGIITQNKPDFKMGKMTISPATTKPYLNEQRTMNNERCSKQTQSNPIPASRDTIRDIQYDMPHTRQQARSVSAGVFTTRLVASSPQASRVARAHGADTAPSEPGPHTPNGQPDYQNPTTRELFHHQQKH